MFQFLKNLFANLFSSESQDDSYALIEIEIPEEHLYDDLTCDIYDDWLDLGGEG